jgi:hypothetical protein
MGLLVRPLHSIVPPTLARLLSLPAALGALEREAVSQGFGMLTRLRKEWETGANRFDRAGEVLLGAFRAGGAGRGPTASGWAPASSSSLLRLSPAGPHARALRSAAAPVCHKRLF